MLGYAVVFRMHEQGTPLVLGAYYSPTASIDDVETMRDKLISVVGVLDSRYTRETYQIIDVQQLHHRMALGQTTKEERDALRDILPEVWEVAQDKAPCGMMFRVTHGWSQMQQNRDFFNELS